MHTRTHAFGWGHHDRSRRIRGGSGGGAGFNTYEGGIEVRVPRLGARVLPFAQASLGRVHWSGDMRYTYAGLGAGAELFLSERLAVRPTRCGAAAAQRRAG